MTELNPKHPQISTRAGDRRQWGQLPGSAAALALVNAAYAHQGLSLIITADTASAQRLEAELSFFSSGDLDILHLADWETLPYDTISPHQDIISERLRTLFKLPSVRQGLLVVPVTSLLQRLMPTEYLLAGSFMLKVGDRLDLDTLRSNLTKAGYRSVDTVYEHGEYAVRGSLIDLYPMGSERPLRIDLFDDEIDSLRTFDPDTQLTENKIEHIELLPAREYPLDKQSISAFKQRWHQRFDVDPTACSIYRDISDGIAPPGIEYYLPLFFEHTSTLFDYLPDNTIAYTLGDINPAVEHFWSELSARYQSRRVDNTRPLLAPEEIYLRSEELFGALKQLSRTDLHTDAVDAGPGRDNFACAPRRPCRSTPRANTR